MYRIFNLILFILVIIFFISIFIHYSSNKHVKNINLNRSNIDKIIKSKIINLPRLENDTNNVIEFNASFSEEIKDSKPRSFWNLLKTE